MIKRDKIALILGPLLLVLLGAALRLYGIGRDSLWYDELYTIWSSHLPLASLVREEAASRHMPDYYLLLHFWLYLSTGRIWIVLISFFSGCGSILLVFLIARRLFNKKVAFWALAMAAFSPIMIWYSQDVTYYSWVIFTTLLSFYFLIRAHNYGGWQNWFLYFLATTLAIFSYTFSTVLVVANFVFIWLIKDRKRSQLSFYLTHALLLAELGFVLALNFIFSPAAGLFRRASISMFKDKLTSGIFSIRLTMLGGPIGSFGGHKELMIDLAVIAILMIVAAGGWRFWTGEPAKALTVYTAILILGPILLYSLLADTTDPNRFYVWAVPFFLILGSAFIVQALKPASLFLVLAIIWFAIFALPVLERHDFSNTNWDAAVQVVSENYRKGDAILGFPINGFSVAAYYYQSDLPIQGGIIIDDKTVRLYPAGRQWSGYGSSQTESVLSGAQLASGINLLAGKTKRMWVLSGDGKMFPKPLSINRNIPIYWEKINHWHVGGFFLDLYQRNR